MKGLLMDSKLEKLPESRVKITIKTTPDEFKEYYDKALITLSQKIKLPGFRPGKVPADIALRNIGEEAVKAEAVEESIPNFYYQAIIEQKLHPVSKPEVEVKSIDNGLEFVASVDVLPEVTVKDWKNIRIKKNVIEKVTSDAVAKVTQQLRKERAKFNEPKGPVKPGDFASISFEGSVGGVLREDMASKSHPLVVGENTMIPGFEENIVGMKVGEDKEFEINFPKDYHAKDLAKKKAKFKITLENHREIELPEADDNFAKLFGKDTFADFERAIEEELSREGETESKRKDEDMVLSELAKRTKVTLPKSMVDEEVSRLFENMKKRLGLDELKLAMFLEKQKKTAEEVKQEMRDQASKNVTVGLALGEVMKDMDVKPDDKDAISKVLEKMLESATK
jgi:trigger factor